MSESAPVPPPIRTPWYRDLLLVLVFDTLIAVLYAAILRGGFTRSFLWSQCIGISIFTCTEGLMYARGMTKPDGRIMAVAVPVGALIGAGLGYVLAPVGGNGYDTALLPGSLVAAAIFGVAISYFFYARTTIAETRAALQRSALDATEAERRRTEAELKALQAQIEPHFLFNTLSNVASLIDSDPATARRMLTSFTAYLRGSLDRTRDARSTLGQELDLVRRYLEIMAIRMGDRLRWRVESETGIDAAVLPPLTLQPLVENAIEHGLGPRPAGGEVVVRARRDGADAVIEVSDTGVGLDPVAKPGVGIDNVRARLSATFGLRASVTLAPVAPHGVCVTLRVPA